MSKELADEILDPGPPGPVKKTRDEALADLEAEGRKRGYIITIFGADWPFIFPERTSQIDAYRKEAREFAAQMAAGEGLTSAFTSAIALRDVENDGPMDSADFINAYTIHFWSDPEQDGGKVDQVQALKLVALRPGGCQFMVGVIEAGMIDAQVIRISEQVHREKKGSKPASKTGSSSKQR